VSRAATTALRPHELPIRHPVITHPSDSRDIAARFSRRLVLTVSLGSLVVFGAVAWLLAAVGHRHFPPPLRGPQSAPLQLTVGVLAGGLASVAFTTAFLRAGALRGARDLAYRIFARVAPSTADLVVVAVAAGVGEELLFRGTVQPLLGLWWTSLIFALLHSGVPRSRGRAAYGCFVFAVSTALGVLYRRSGLTAAMSAHAAVDLVFLLWVQWRISRAGASERSPR
jgi:uncharacterized protein